METWYALAGVDRGANSIATCRASIQPELRAASALLLRAFEETQIAVGLGSLIQSAIGAR